MASVYKLLFYLLPVEIAKWGLFLFHVKEVTGYIWFNTAFKVRLDTSQIQIVLGILVDLLAMKLES